MTTAYTTETIAEMLSRITPGELHLGSNGLTVLNEQGICIAEIFQRGTETPSPEANAKFYAAAPSIVRQLLVERDRLLVEVERLKEGLQR